MASNVTLKDVAAHAGVSKSTASDVLRKRKGVYKISDATRKRVYDAVETLGYQPTSAARALSTGKTYHMGFLLSSRATLGLANSYYATVMAGVQEVCQLRGYQLSVSTYDLSNLKNFVMPPKMKQRSVDGVVIAGRVQPDVIRLLQAEDIPFILHGQSTEYPLDDIMTVATDMVANWEQILSYLIGLGHRKIYAGSLSGEYAIKPINTAIETLQQSNGDIAFDVVADLVELDSRDEFERGYDYAVQWCQEDSSARPTAVVLNCQWALGFLYCIGKAGFSCPEDVSIFSTSDTPMAKFATPPISALDQDPFRVGQDSSDILIDFIEKKIDKSEAFARASRSCRPGKLVIRESTAMPKK